MAIWYNNADFTQYCEPAQVRRDRKYSEILAAIDFEWSTLTDRKPAISFMYLWTLSIEDITVYGRTWEDLRECLLNIQSDLKLNKNYRLVMYDQNMKVDFAFFKTQLEISIRDKEFLSRDTHSVIKCVVNDCFELRDSHELTERPLAAMGYIVRLPKIDDYDYSKIRHSSTPLTDHEIEYAGRDTEIIIAYLRREIAKYGSVKSVPLTGTRVVKNQIWENYKSFGSIVSTRKNQLHDTPEDMEMLQRLIRAYFGAFNYCTTIEDNKVFDDILSVDIQSCYGGQILLNRFPIKRFKPAQIPADWRTLLHMDKYAYIVTVNVKNLCNIYPRIGFLPYNKEWHLSGEELQGNTILKLKSGILTLTDVDFKLMCDFYTFDADKLKIIDLHISKYAPLPGYIVKTVVDNYIKKVQAKKVISEIKKTRQPTADEENEYQIAKTNVSRIYGVFVQRPLLIDYYFDRESGKVKERKDENSKPVYRFTKTDHDPVLYQWGVWVTAYGRREILQNFAAVGLYRDTDGDGYNKDSVLYAATDSLKFKFDVESINIINDYNERVKSKLRYFCKMYGYKYEDLEGIGEFEIEHYQKFKAVGVSKYCYVDDNDVFTAKVSGLSRDNKYFDQFETNAKKIDALQPDMMIPDYLAQTRKTTYYDTPYTANVVDYLGNAAEVSERSYCVLGIQKFDSRPMSGDFMARVTKADIYTATNPTKII